MMPHILFTYLCIHLGFTTNSVDTYTHTRANNKRKINQFNKFTVKYFDIALADVVRLHYSQSRFALHHTKVKTFYLLITNNHYVPIIYQIQIVFTAAENIIYQDRGARQLFPTSFTNTLIKYSLKYLLIHCIATRWHLGARYLSKLHNCITTNSIMLVYYECCII